MVVDEVLSGEFTHPSVVLWRLLKTNHLEGLFPESPGMVRFNGSLIWWI
jgi:hypothetical protein